ncbi:hypothetical protein J7T55_005241 [Diaporthe amygdali]|uniref:uncharacterized protein n=1 Tax=Phomopsis amygdali TaxID=1214568 RepID=UPI0022FF3F10|nr:uncharacterized protein J7T55_005241 [Diaporthe amygdali]KAJ0116295.1 hypothetical protein J7T55_005241 [Diaporthe amygdali]
MPTMDDDHESDCTMEDPSYILHATPARVFLDRSLTNLRHCATPDQAVRLLETYQEIIGDLHPILDISRLKQQAIHYFSKATCEDVAIDEDDLITLHLTQSIALIADGKSSIQLERSRLGCIYDMANQAVMSPATRDMQATMALLMGFHAFFGDEIQVAWRMCGLAGRIAMELGLHCYDTSNPTTSYEDERPDRLSTLLSSIFILDRQWSASAGLPNQFVETSFDITSVLPLLSHYLNAMMAFCMISDKFAEPITKVAQGLSFDNEDELELTDFKIDQWRRKFVLNQEDFEPPCEWIASGPPETLPVPLLIMYLRANSVRGLLLRSSFISSSVVSKDKTKSALGLVSDTLDTLKVLDDKSNIYRRLRPHFQHILASASSLLCLVAVKLKKDRSPDWSASDFADIIGHNFQTALHLSAAHASTSQASWKLWKRLNCFEGALHRTHQASQNVDSEGQVANPQAQSSNAVHCSPVARASGPIAELFKTLIPPEINNSAVPSDSCIAATSLGDLNALDLTTPGDWLWKEFDIF